MVVEDAVQEKIAGVRREEPIVKNQEEDVAIKSHTVVVKF
jgi:hypothetical protein